MVLVDCWDYIEKETNYVKDQEGLSHWTGSPVQGYADGEIRKKRGDTLVKTLRKIYGDNFAPDVRSDTRLDTLRKLNDGSSLSKIIKDS